jgi:hypothetical protein
LHTTNFTLGEKKANVKWSFGESQSSVLFSRVFTTGILLLMTSSSPRSAAVTAAATLALLGCATCFLVWGYVLLILLDAPADLEGHHLYQLHPAFFLLIAFVPSSVIALGLRTGIGLFQLRPWARLAALIWAAIALAFCLVLIALRPFETFVIPDTFVGSAQSLQQLATIAFIILLLPASVWWLFLFRSKSVKLQFAAPSGASAKS